MTTAGPICAHAFDIFSLNKPAQTEQIPEDDDDDDLFGDDLFGDDLNERDELGDVRTQSPGIKSASTAQETDEHWQTEEFTQSSLSDILVLASPSESTSFLPPPELCMPTSLPPLQEGYNFSNFTSTFLPPKYQATMAPVPAQPTYMNPKPRRPKLGQSTAPSAQPVDDALKIEHVVWGSGKNAQVAASGAENIRWAPAPVRRKSKKKRVAKKPARVEHATASTLPQVPTKRQGDKPYKCLDCHRDVAKIDSHLAKSKYCRSRSFMVKLESGYWSAAISWSEWVSSGRYVVLET